MKYDPIGKWSAGALNNDFGAASPHPTPWEFLADGTMQAAGHWKGTYKGIASQTNSFECEITTNNGNTDAFEVHFVTSTRMVATKNDALYRYAKKL